MTLLNQNRVSHTPYREHGAGKVSLRNYLLLNMVSGGGDKDVIKTIDIDIT